MLTQAEYNYYNRQIRLPEVGEAGQKKLHYARVLVVGGGGLGSAALFYLASAGIGTLGICEPDILAVHNLHRQILYQQEDLGLPKASLAVARLKALNPHINIQSHAEHLCQENSVSLFEQYDLVVDGTDNFLAKFLINDTAVLTATPAIQAAIYQWEGQLMAYHPKEQGPCLRCLWSTIPDSNCIATCAEVGVLGAIAGILGSMQALEVIKVILELPTPLTAGEMIIFNLLDLRMQTLQRAKNPSCSLCGGKPTIKAIQPALYIEPVDTCEIALTNNSYNKYIWIDIREPDEIQTNPDTKLSSIIPSFEKLAYYHVPLSQFDATAILSGPDKCYLLFCEFGVRSKQLANKLRSSGRTNVYSLKGGLQSLHYLMR